MILYQNLGNLQTEEKKRIMEDYLRDRRAEKTTSPAVSSSSTLAPRQPLARVQEDKREGGKMGISNLAKQGFRIRGASYPSDETCHIIPTNVRKRLVTLTLASFLSPNSTCSIYRVLLLRFSSARALIFQKLKTVLYLLIILLQLQIST